jgi:psiF repeat
MNNTEEPVSPGKQQAATKLADCKQQAKAKKLTGAKRREFLKECANRQTSLNNESAGVESRTIHVCGV